MDCHEHTRFIPADNFLAMMYRSRLEIRQFMSVNMEPDGLRFTIQSGDAIDILEIFMNVNINRNIIVHQRMMEGDHAVEGIG